MKTDKRTILIIGATVVLAGLAIFGAWRLYQLRGQAVAPTAPKLVPAQEVASCPTVSFPVSGAGCPVNSTCCLQPLTTCTNSLQCGSGHICYLEYCVKQTYDPATNTCPAAQPQPQPVGSGGEGDGGGGGAPPGGGAPAVTPSPSPRPSPSPSPGPAASPSPSPTPGRTPSPSPGATATPKAGSGTSPSPTQIAKAGTSTSAPSATTKAGGTKAPEKLPEAGVSWPFAAIIGGGVLLLILGVVLAF